MSDKTLNEKELAAVHGARLADVANKIAAQTAVVIVAGNVARTFATETAHQLANHRLAVALALVNDTFEKSPLGDPEHLARHDKRFLQATALAGCFTTYLDKENEIASLRQLRSHFEPVLEAVKTEPELKLAFPEAWLK